MSPWFSGRMPEDTFTIARALKAGGYTTGHSGKWHIAINRNAFPRPKDVGFDWTRSARGATEPVEAPPHDWIRHQKSNDPYKLDENGFSTTKTQRMLWNFCTTRRIVHSFSILRLGLYILSIQTRSKALLEKYVRKLGVELPKDPKQFWQGKGQTNPFYCAMVEMLDYYVQLIQYLEQTDDPRWPDIS